MNPAAQASDSLMVAAVFLAVDPAGLGGAELRGPGGPQRARWLAFLKGLLPVNAPLMKLPLHVAPERLLGGLDLTATLHAGRPIAQRGLLAQADSGVVVVSMAERITVSTAASLCAVMDTREVVVERHGVGSRCASSIGVVALDEGQGDGEQVPTQLRERLAFHLVLDAGSDRTQRQARQERDHDSELQWTREAVAAARERLADVRIDDELIEGLCAAGLALGVDSVRATLMATRAARVAAALDGRDTVTTQDAALAAAMVLVPRATRVPAQEDAADSTEQTQAEDSSDTRGESPPERDAESNADELDADVATAEEIILEAALAAIPKGLLDQLCAGSSESQRGPSARGAGAARSHRSRGRPIGARRGDPTRGARLNVIETLRAAAPWQQLRRREACADGRVSAARILVRRDDFHVWRYMQRSETTTLVVVDASGSSALHRLAEAKGAVELLLADCYIRRDSVALIAFRGTGAEILLPPTRSLVRAKRSLAGLPGGGGTPLACGMDAAAALADSIRSRGATPVVVMLTDGRANIARDGTPGRAAAARDALEAARQWRAQRFATLVLDTSPQPQDSAMNLAAAMGARYLPLPHAGASALSQAVRTVGSGSAPPR